MKRRSLLTTAVSAGLAAPMIATTASAQSSGTFRLLTDRPDSATALAARLGAVSGGRISIQVDVAAANSDMLAAVASGEADFCLAAPDAFVSNSPAFGLFGAMPFGMSSSELEAWVIASDGQDMWNALGADIGVSFVLAGDDGAAPIWSKEPLGDLSGLSVGASGLSALSFAALGAEVVDIRSPDVARDALDAIEGFGPRAMADAGLADAFPHVTLSNPNRPSGMVALGMNNARMESLSEVDRYTVHRAATAHHSLQRAERFHDDATTLSTSTSVAAQVPDPVWQAMRDAAEGVLTTVFDSSPKAASAVDAYIYFLAEVSIWSDIGEAAYYMGRKQVAAL